MGVTADFTNFYVNGSTGNALNGGSSAGAPIIVADVTAVHDGSGIHTLTDNGTNGFAGAAQGNFLCWDTGGTPEWARVNSVTSDDVIVVLNITGAQAFTNLSNRAVRVGGPWLTINGAAARLKTTFVNAAGLPPKCWIKAGTYAAEGGSTGFVDVTTNAGTAALPLSLEGYTTAEGDCAADDVVHINATGSNKHGVNITKAWWSFRGFKVTSNAASKSAWNLPYSGGAVAIEDCSAVASGNTSSHGMFISGWIASLVRFRTVSAAGDGINTTYGYLQMDGCKITATGYGLYSGSVYVINIRNSRFHDLTGGSSSHAVFVGTLYDSFYGISGCTFCNVHGDAIRLEQQAHEPIITNCVFEDIDGYPVNPLTPGNTAVVSYCAFYDCGSGGEDYFPTTMLNKNSLLDATSSHNVFQTAGSFFAETTNFTLNNTAGRGRLCRGTGYPAYRDIGAMQSMVAAGSIVDSAGAVSAGPGILDGDGDVYPSGVLEADTGIYGSYGVVDIAGVTYEFGILSNDGIVHQEGVLEDSGVNYYTLASEDSTPYLAGFEAGGGGGAALSRVRLGM